MPSGVKFDPRISAAIRAKDLEFVKRFFAENPDYLDSYTPFAGGTWLHVAASDGDVPIVRHLISIGMDVNEGDMRDGRSPLVNAAHENYDVAVYLLDQGAKMDVSASVRNPLFAAIAGRSPDIAKLLLDRGIDSTARYNSATMKEMDAVAFAMMHGTRDIAHMIALKNAEGDELKAQTAMAEGLRIAHENTVPVPPGEEYAPS